MPYYRKRYTYRPRVYRKRYYRKRGASTKTVWRIANKAITSKAEKKWLENSIVGGNFDNTAPQLTYLSSVPQGDTANAREGNRISPTSLRFNCSVEASSTLQSNVYRCLIIQWLADETVTPMTVNDFLQNTTAVTAVFSSYKQQSKFRFKILYDQKRTVSPSTGRAVAQFNVMIPAKKLKSVYYDGAALGQNQLFFCLLDERGTPANISIYNYYAIFRYTDS